MRRESGVLARALQTWLDKYIMPTEQIKTTNINVDILFFTILVHFVILCYFIYLLF